MSFNELNTVEHYIIQKLSGVNLNSGKVVNSSDKSIWLYKSSDKINRDNKDIIVEEDFKKAFMSDAVKVTPDDIDDQGVDIK